MKSLKIQHYKKNNLTSFYCFFLIGIFSLYLIIPRGINEITSYFEKGYLSENNESVSSFEIIKNESFIQNLFDLDYLDRYNHIYKDQKVSYLLKKYQSYLTQDVRKSQNTLNIKNKIYSTIETSLRTRPSKPNYWYLLAEVSARQQDPGSRPNKFLRMSYLTGMREGWVATERLKFVLSNWRYVSDAVRAFAKKDIHLLWEHHYFKYELAQIFANTSTKGKKIIYSQINRYGYQEIKILSSYLKRKGYFIGENLLYSIVK